MLGSTGGYKLEVTGPENYYLVKDNPRLHGQARKVLTLQIVSKSNRKNEP